MITVIGYSIQLPPELQFLANIWGSFLATVIAWALIALVVYVLFTYGLRFLTRKTETEIDDIVIAILEKPLIILIVVFGTLNSLEVLELSKDTVAIIEHISNTVLTLILAYLGWRILRDIVVYYGEALAEKTESRVDDVMVPLANLFGPVVIILAMIGAILTIWGIDIGAVLAGAGITVIVLGFALQDTLGNMFSGLSLLADAPFRTKDMIMYDGTVCQVTRISLRVTELYNTNDHSVIFVPNKDLANSKVINLTKPTVDLKVSIPIGVEYGSDLDDVKEKMETIANTHPNVLGNIQEKLPLIKKAMMGLPDGEKRTRYSKMHRKLELEDALNNQILDLAESLQVMSRAIHEMESGGLDARELEEICQKHLTPTDLKVTATIDKMSAWAAIDDPWVEDDEELREIRDKWETYNKHLHDKWKALQRICNHPSQEQEMRLDDMAQKLAEWLLKDYKIPPQPWKEPEASFDKFADSSVNLILDFYVDDIRQEHFQRQQRVVTEIAKEIHTQIGPKMPFPQIVVTRKS